MNIHQQTALDDHCRLACETAAPRFRWLVQHGRVSVMLTVNSGYE